MINLPLNVNTENFNLSFIGFAHKICEDDGEWFRHPDSNRTWTNYTTCIDVNDFEVFTNFLLYFSYRFLHVLFITNQMRRQVNLIYVTGYTISLIAILLSIFIFCYFRYV
jgi:calcitonin receptor-like